MHTLAIKQPKTKKKRPKSLTITCLNIFVENSCDLHFLIKSLPTSCKSVKIPGTSGVPRGSPWYPRGIPGSTMWYLGILGYPGVPRAFLATLWEKMLPRATPEENISMNFNHYPVVDLEAARLINHDGPIQPWSLYRLPYMDAPPPPGCPLGMQSV